MVRLVLAAEAMPVDRRNHSDALSSYQHAGWWFPDLDTDGRRTTATQLHVSVIQLWPMKFRKKNHSDASRGVLKSECMVFCIVVYIQYAIALYGSLGVAGTVCTVPSEFFKISLAKPGLYSI